MISPARHLAARHVERRTRRPLIAKLPPIGANRSDPYQPRQILRRLAVTAKPRMHRHPVFAQRERRRGHFGQRHGAETGERSGEGIESRRNTRRQQALAGDLLESERTVIVDSGARRGDFVAVDRDYAVRACHVNEHRCLAADRMHMRIDDALDQGRGNRGVDGVAAASEHPRARGSREVVFGGDHRLSAHHLRIKCGHKRPTLAVWKMSRNKALRDGRAAQILVPFT